MNFGHAVRFDIQQERISVIFNESLAILNEIILLEYIKNSKKDVLNLKKEKELAIELYIVEKINGQLYNNLKHVNIERYVVEELDAHDFNLDLKELEKSLEEKYIENERDVKIGKSEDFEYYIKENSQIWKERFYKSSLYYFFSYALAMVLAINMYHKLKENKEYKTNILNAINLKQDTKLEEILKVLDIDLEDENTYNIVFKKVEEIEKNILGKKVKM